MLSTPFLLCVQFVQFPLDRVVFDIAVGIVIIGLIADYVVVEGSLPDVFTVFFVAKAFERGHEASHKVVTFCRGRASSTARFQSAIKHEYDSA